MMYVFGWIFGAGRRHHIRSSAICAFASGSLGEGGDKSEELRGTSVIGLLGCDLRIMPCLLGLLGASLMLQILVDSRNAGLDTTVTVGV